MFHLLSRLANFFTRHFIAHEGNGHRPHILRAEGIRGIMAVVILLELITFVIPTLTNIHMTGGMAAVLPAVLHDLTNAEREDRDLETLTVNPILNRAAEMKARDMAEKGYFAHTSPDGKTPWYWLEAVGYEYQYAGENLAINFSDSKDVAEAWMDSPSHRANIVKKNYTEIGTGVATGVYEGQKTVFVAQVYANPAPKAVAAEPPAEQNIPAAPAPRTVTRPTPQTIVTPQVAIAPQAAVAPQPTNILGAEEVPTGTVVKTVPAEPLGEPTMLQKLVASPRNTMNIFLYIVSGMIALALVLNIGIRIRQRHLDLVTNGLVAMALIGAIFTVNYYATHTNMVIAMSLDYAGEIPASSDASQGGRN